MIRHVALPFMLALLLIGSMAPASPEIVGSGEHSVQEDSPTVPRADRVVVYYFHQTARCENCLKFEAYADEALRQFFAAELASGDLDWRVVNLDDTTNAHFVDDYALFESSIIISNVRGEEEINWRNLDAIWHLVNDKDRFIEYVAVEVEEDLGTLREHQPHDGSSALPHLKLAPVLEDAGLREISQQ